MSTPQPLLNVQRLIAFSAVAETLSFTRAARKLGMAQQLVSSQIARLEHDLGIVLFERNTRSVQLSVPGRRLYADAQDILGRLEAAQRNVVLASQGQTGSIAIGCGEYAVESVLPQLLHQFRELYPDVAVSLYEQRTAAQVTALRNGEIDVGLALLPPEVDDIEVETLIEQGFCIATAERPERANLQPVTLAHFKDASFVATPRSQSPGLESMKDRMFREADFTPNVVQYAAQPLTLLALVAADVGILLCPEVMSKVKYDGVMFVPVTSPYRVHLGMITRRNVQKSQVLANFCSLARATSQ